LLSDPSPGDINRFDATGLELDPTRKRSAVDDGRFADASGANSTTSGTSDPPGA
jgi:hypothetical protein